MARTKQVAPCLFCDELPCVCESTSKEKKSRAKKKAATPKARHQDADTISDTESVPPTEGNVPQGESVPAFPSQSNRKRARFAKASQSNSDQSVSTDVSEERRLQMDEEAVAIRNLAAVGLLHRDELKKHRKLLEPNRPDVTERLKEWRNKREA